jgi:hypothetical protein
MDNGRYRISDFVIVEFLRSITLTEPKAVIHKQGDEDLEFYTKSEMYEWLAKNNYKEMAILDGGDGIWAIPSEGW